MTNNGNLKLAAPLPGGHILGQPFTITGVGVPVNASITCNCGGADTDVKIEMSRAAACPSCRKVYNMLFNPTNGKLEMHIAAPDAEQVPS